jgi:Zn-dependent protease
MKWSFRIGRVRGIDVRVHATFFIFLIWIGLSGFLREGTAAAAVNGMLFMVTVFATVVLHEFGHALTAQHFGIHTRDITLLPIGGVARLDRMPEKPRQELLVALAGPAVNVAFALMFLLVLRIRGQSTAIDQAAFDTAPLLVRLLWVNGIMAAFNLLPAFPMDGGRALRALLALRGDYVGATRTAARLGQGIAFLLGLLGLFSNPMLVFIALFVWIGAAGETQAVEMKHAMANIPVQSAMVTAFTTLSTSDTLATATSALLHGTQIDFPVVDDHGHLVGVLSRTRFIDGLAKVGMEGSVVDAMTRSFEVTHPSEMLDVAFARLQTSEAPLMPVIDGDCLVGLITLENVGELLMVKEAIGKRSA